MKTGIIYSGGLKYYDFGPGHSFRGDRFGNFLSYFKERLGGNEEFEVVMNDELASHDDLLLGHEGAYIQAMLEASAGRPPHDLLRFISRDNLNPISRRFPLGIEKAARVIVKNSILACELVHEGRFEKCVSIGGGLHHAKPGYGEGFCIYNDVVISTNYLIKKYGLEKILVLDTDAHAGNGTCEAFYSNRKVLFIDIHQRNIYPGTGYENEIGDSEGKGFTVNVPLPAFAGDDTYKLVFDEIVLPLAEEFNPQFIIRNGGSDPHFRDEITHLGLTLEGFKNIGRTARQIAELCQGKEIDLICSGYNPSILPSAWLAIVSGLANVEVDLEEPLAFRVEKNRTFEEARDVVAEVKNNLRQYWKSMN
jgi:acetoin utilization protein AcuC